MKHERDIDRLLDHWLSDGPSEAPDRVLDAVADRIDRQPQRPAWRLRSWRDTDMRRTLPAVAAVAAVVIVAVIGFNLVNSSTPVGDSPSPTPGGIASPSATAGQTPTPSPSATPAALLEGGTILLDYTRYYGEDPAHLAQLDGSMRVVPFASGTRLETAPAWSPDGQRIAFARYAEVDPADPANHWTPSAIYLQDVSGLSASNLSADCEAPACLGERDPAFSPDGKRLAFVRWDEEASFLAIRDLASATVTELRSTTSDRDRSDVHRPTWSPDGMSLAYHVVDRLVGGTPTSSAVFIVGLDDDGLRRLTPSDLLAGDAAWSPDGSTILFDTLPYREWLFEAAAPEARHLYAIAPDGSGMRRLDASGGASAPSWIADGRLILYSLFRTTNDGRLAVDLHVMDPDGTNDRTIATPPGCCHGNAVQQPTP